MIHHLHGCLEYNFHGDMTEASACSNAGNQGEALPENERSIDHLLLYSWRKRLALNCIIQTHTKALDPENSNVYAV